MLKNILAFLLVLFVIIFIYLGWRTSQVYSNSISGMFSASPEFLEKAEISNMFLYVGEPFKNGPFTEKRYIYLVMHHENTIIANKQLEMEIKKSLNSYIISNENKYNVRIYELDDDDDSGVKFSDIMPENLELYFDITMGRMSLKGDDNDDDPKLYAELYKSS
jgi:hypothetical protein